MEQLLDGGTAGTAGCQTLLRHAPHAAILYSMNFTIETQVNLGGVPNARHVSRVEFRYLCDAL